MAATLLEREATLEALSRAVTDAAAGRGSVVLVTGEAGIGKTSLIRAFADDAGQDARILLSACDDLMAPRTLGPLRDAALGGDGPLAAALAEDEPVEDVFTALLEELAAAPPTVLVVEDLHWADDATLDVLAYAARRVEAAGGGARADLPRRRGRRRGIRSSGCSACSRPAPCTASSCGRCRARRWGA